jgi:hypothetical protein
MAAKKKTKRSKPAPKKSAPKEVESLAVKILGRLPALDTKLRLAFRTTFTDEQCEGWGSRTEAVKVLAEAGQWLGPLHSAVEKKTVGGYSARRLAFLAELLVALEDEIAATAGPDGLPHRGARRSAVTYAKGVRRDLLDRLGLVAGGRDELRALVHSRDEGEGSLEDLRDSLAGLIELAGRWRRDPVLELLADDAELSVARLGGAYNALEALARADEVLRAVDGATGDSDSVNRIEGRVLRELHLAQTAFARARELGEAVPNLVAGPTLKKGFA